MLEEETWVPGGSESQGDSMCLVPRPVGQLGAGRKTAGWTALMLKKESRSETRDIAVNKQVAEQQDTGFSVWWLLSFLGTRRRRDLLREGSIFGSFQPIGISFREEGRR